jgi:hypothetical protein
MKAVFLCALLVSSAVPAWGMGGKPPNPLLECPTAKAAFSTTTHGKIRRCVKEPLPGMIGR